MRPLAFGIVLFLVSCGSSPNSSITYLQNKSSSALVADYLRGKYIVKDAIIDDILSPLNPTLSTYELGTVDVDKNTVIKLADRAGLESKISEVSDSPSHFWTYSGDWYLEVNKFSGQELVADMSIYRNHVENATWNLNESQLAEIASRRVREMEGSFANELTLEKILYTRYKVGNRITNEEYETIVDADVIFRPSIDGIRVTGSGGKVVVTISESGNVAAYYRLVRDVLRMRQSVYLRSIEEVISDLEAAVNEYRGSSSSIPIEIQDYKFAYWESGRHWKQSLIAPAHIFEIIGYNSTLETSYRKRTLVISATNSISDEQIVGQHGLNFIATPTPR